LETEQRWYFLGILREAGNASRIDYVTDQYPEISITNTERHGHKRGEAVSWL